MKLILTIFGVQTVFRKHYCLAFLFPTELWLSCVRYRKGALNMWRLSLLNYLVLMKGARWRALGTQAIFLSAKLPQNKKWQIYQAPVTGSSCDCLSPGLELVTLKGTGLLCHPSLQLWVLLLERAMKVTQWDKADTQLSLSCLGCYLLILHKFCWQVGLNWFHSPVISKKENLFLTGVGLDDWMDYLLLSVSHFDDPASNEPSSLLKHSRVVEAGQCEWKVLCRLISWWISVHIVKHWTKKGLRKPIAAICQGTNR